MKSTGLTFNPDSARDNLDGEGDSNACRSSGVSLRCGSSIFSSSYSSSEDTVASLIVEEGGSEDSWFGNITETSRSSSSDDSVGR